MGELRLKRPRLAGRLARCGACAAMALAFVAAPGQARAASTDTSGITYDTESESQTSGGIESNNGVSTGSSSTTSTTTTTGSDGSSTTNTTTTTNRADGSKTVTTHQTSQDADGSQTESNSQEDQNGAQHERNSTEETTDPDGHKTTTVRKQTLDDDGNVVHEDSYKIIDKVPPPGTPAPPPPAWTGTITYSFTGEAGGNDADGIKTSGSYADAAAFMVDMKAHEATYWDVSGGTAVGSTAEELTGTDPSGGTWQMMLAGGDSAGMPLGACSLQLSLDGRTYTLTCADVAIPGVTYMGYEGTKLEEGPRDTTWAPPKFEVKGIVPSAGGALSGSRKVRVFVPTAGSTPVEVMADIGWSLTPMGTSRASAAPSKPPTPDREVQLDQPPQPMVLDKPGQPIVVGFEVQIGQKATVHLTANKAGSVTVELRRPDGSLAMVGATDGESFSLPAQTIGETGTYSVVLKSTAGKTGELSLAVTSH